MATNFMTYSRLEPRTHEYDLEAGFQAALHDPVWFLGRQWQMGEMQGENATSPVWVDYTLRSQTITAADARFDPTVTPAEAIVESELDDWWTMGRRVRIGKRLAALHPDLLAERTLCFAAPPPPYESFRQQLDGRALWRRRDDLGLTAADFGAEIPPDSTPAWDNEALIYQQHTETAFTAGDQQLVVQQHRGGRLDWHSVDATPLAGGADPLVETGEAIPTQLHYPGAPANRWWQIEDAAVDIGGYPPDSAHTPTALLTELIFSHSDDWFLFPVSSSVGHRAGHRVALAALTVTDAFGRTYTTEETNANGDKLWPGLQPPTAWSLFQVDGVAAEEAGLPPVDLLLWHVAELPLESGAVERVQLGLDEEANLLWAVERTLDGREVAALPVAAVDDAAHPRFNNGKAPGDARAAKEYAYVPAQGIAPYWHPYEIAEVADERRLVQRQLADLSRQKPVSMPKPQADLLQSPTIRPLAIPSNGIELERRWQLARDMRGAPVLWMQRQRRPLLSPPARRLRFDVMEEATTE
ncbi:MAG: hypothetical protein DYG89_03370 [Caldilinea sp. CFX5]|nr:hypothetical protein [Caldilinea sp. CFX5]